MSRSRKDKIIYLLSFTKTQNAMKDTIKTPVKRLIYADEKSIRQSEHYQAAANGLKPEIMFVVWRQEYDGEASLEYDDVTYNITRVYSPNAKETELICSRPVNKAVT